MRDRFHHWLEGLRVPGRPNEFEVKRLLADIGLAVPDGLLLAPEDPPTPPEFHGPYVVKVCTPDILHKTDVGGVAINVAAAELGGIVADFRGRFPGEHLLVEAQQAAGAQEIIVGALVDPVFGPAVMVGAGGVLTEIYRDVAFRLPPFDVREARRMLTDLRIYPVFEGYRGIALDPDQLAGVLSTIGYLVMALEDRLEELDINPLVFSRGRWTVLDAKLILTPP